MRARAIVACVALLSGYTVRSAADGPAACETFTQGEVQSVLGVPVAPGRAKISDSGPDGVTGCDFQPAGDRAAASVSVWALRKNATSFFRRLDGIPLGKSITTRHGYEYVSHVDISDGWIDQEAFLLKNGEYLNIDVRIPAQVPPTTTMVDRLADVAAAKLH